MCLFINDYGYTGWIVDLFLVMFVHLLMFFFFFLATILANFIETTCLLKVIKIFLQLIILISFICLLFFIVDTGGKIITKSQASFIPQYGTQSQKEMLLLCLKHEKNNKLSNDEQKYISNTINNIMETCYKHHLMGKINTKKLLEEQKQELKDKEVLESLNKMMDNQ